MGSNCSDCNDPNQVPNQGFNAIPIDDQNRQKAIKDLNSSNFKKTSEKKNNGIEMDIQEPTSQFNSGYNSVQVHDPPSNKAEVLNEQISIQDQKSQKIVNQWGQIDVNQLKKQQSDSVFIDKYFLLKDTHDIYYGEWWAGLRHGFGQQYFQDGGIYRGYFKNDQLNGEGKFIYKNGDYYEGHFLNGQRQGRGRLTDAEGNIYEGNFANDQKHGQGKQSNPLNLTFFYWGEYQNGMKWGKGKQRVDDQEYTGDFVHDKYHGKGKCVWDNGKQYEGDFENQKMQGKGIYSWSDGKIYEGELFEDSFNGYGEFKWPDGTLYKGQWLNGEMHGQGQITTGNKVQQVEFNNGKKVVSKSIPQVVN